MQRTFIAQKFILQTLVYNSFFQEFPKKMKLTQSQTTEATKQSQLKIPLLYSNSQLLQTQLTIFTERDGKKYKLMLPLKSKSISELVLEAARQFNQNFQLKLKNDPSYYFLYAAKKNGKIESDYPALEPSQNIILTKIGYFYLKEKAPDMTRQRIKSNFGWQRNKEIKTQKKTFCPCLFSL